MATDIDFSPLSTLTEQARNISESIRGSLPLLRNPYVVGGLGLLLLAQTSGDLSSILQIPTNVNTLLNHPLTKLLPVGALLVLARTNNDRRRVGERGLQTSQAVNQQLA